MFAHLSLILNISFKRFKSELKLVLILLLE